MANINTDEKKIDELLTRGVADLVDKAALRKKLLSGEQLRVKLGIDPTGPRLHIGRSIPLLKLRDFQELGHQIVLIVGDFTALVGDTSDKDSERPMLTTEQIKTNMASYEEQLGLVINIGQTEIHYNSEWLTKLNFIEIAKLADAFSVHDFVERELIKKRLEAGKRVNLREMLYPIMQGYDSVAIKADVEIGGTDQRFNMLAGRTLTKQAGMPTQDIIMTELINGTDGQKMSTSKGNTVFLNADSNEIFGAIMSIQDDLIIPYFTLLTRESLDVVKKYEDELRSGSNPRDLKVRLAREIVTFYHSAEKADAAEQEFVKVFSHKEQPEQMQIVDLKAGMYELPTLLVETKMVGSKSEAKRLIEQGGVRVDEVQILESKGELAVHDGMVLNVGKRKWARIKVQ